MIIILWLAWTCLDHLLSFNPTQILWGWFCVPTSVSLFFVFFLLQLHFNVIIRPVHCVSVCRVMLRIIKVFLINKQSQSFTHNETFNPATQTKLKLQRPFCKWSKHRSLKQEQQTWRQLSETTWTDEGKQKLQTAFVLLHRWWVKQTRGAEDVRTQSGRAHTAGERGSELVLKSGCITYMSIISLTNIWKFFSSNFQNRLFLL